MFARLKKIWADPVFSRVIANAIWAAGVIIGAAVIAYFVGWLPDITAVASKTISLAAALTPVKWKDDLALPPYVFCAPGGAAQGEATNSMAYGIDSRP
jgi:hypothetical protein